MEKRLAQLVYDKGLKAQIKEYYKAKYEQRIEYLVGANNELMNKLEERDRRKPWKRGVTKG